MKKVLLIISLVFLVGCSTAPEVKEAASSDSSDITALLSEKDNTIAVLEYKVGDLNEQVDGLQLENAALLAASEGQPAGDQPSGFLCEDVLDNMRYDNPIGTIAILEGWFALQPFVQEIQGTYSTTFWSDVNSRIHTMRYIATEDGLTTTSTFLIMFEEAGWQPGILWMTESCWVDFPY
jgi:hypothetical protein